ncbi:YxeA family protein [Cytobacillus sp. IB215665]|uniref:YxeA family protein n=1 Tax=Cytobacillus sp. IB215665 TaxID=3097357 RepID=UPI002A185F04|nr:YxeA family protein [Cytobacillus sp. IB215665]MDX8367217.1 YxeA family protein [Cytobacillus sp. IB215665]
MKKIVGIIIFFILIFGGFLILPNEISDRVNPLIPADEIYVQINKQGTPRSPGGYDYTLNGLTKDGEEKEITFFASGKLRPNAFLKIYAKGSYVETWEEVHPDKLPVKVEKGFEE